MSVESSVNDPGMFIRIRICNKELSIFNLKIVTIAVGNMIRVVYSHPDPGSRGQKALDPGSLVESNLF